MERELALDLLGPLSSLGHARRHLAHLVLEDVDVLGEVLGLGLQDADPLLISEGRRRAWDWDSCRSPGTFPLGLLDAVPPGGRRRWWNLLLPGRVSAQRRSRWAAEPLCGTRHRWRVLRREANEDIAQREVTIMGDREIPYRLLKKIMATATEADYGQISLAVLQKSSDELGNLQAAR